MSNLESTVTKVATGLAHRGDIQSLRALAIALVVATHVHMPGFQGGFVGVDVFFVLSGFLISGLILKEVESARRFDMLRFYARRLKRLLPALLVVLFVTSLFGWMLASPLRQGADAQAGQAASVWMSNFYFSSRTIDYFSAGFGGNLFLHTWSLAVEEQFYVVWPWLFLFLLGVWQWQKAPFDRQRLAIGLSVVALVSFSLSIYWSIENPEVGFYLMPGRMWEFALGALIFLARESALSTPVRSHVRWLVDMQGRSVLNVIGWLLIVTSAMIFTDDLHYPGYLALLPGLGAALVLFDAPQKVPNSPISKLMLDQPGPQFLGNISYSLYLWHWPVLIMGGQLFGHAWSVQLGLVSLSVGLSVLTYFMVENPVRRLQLKNVWVTLVPATAVMAVAFYGMGTWQLAVEKTLSSPAQAHIRMATFDVPKLYTEPGCDTWYHSSKVRACVFGPETAPHTVVLFGDSVLAQWFPAFAKIYLSQPGWRLVVLTKSACSASTVHYYYDRIKSPYTVCDEWRNEAVNTIEAMRPDVVVMGSTHYDFTPEQWISGTRATLDRLSPVAKSVVVMSPTPELGFDGLSCLADETNWPTWLPQVKHCEKPLKPASNYSVFSLLEQAAKPYVNVRVMDFRNQICPGGVCQAQIGQHIVYRDGQHLTASFVRTLAGEVRAKLIAAKILE